MADPLSRSRRNRQKVASEAAEEEEDYKECPIRKLSNHMLFLSSRVESLAMYGVIYS